MKSNTRPVLWQWDLLSCRAVPGDLANSLDLLQGIDFPCSTPLQKEAKNFAPFFFEQKLKLLLVKIENYVSLGVLLFLQKFKTILGNTSLSFTLKTEF